MFNSSPYRRSSDSGKFVLIGVVVLFGLFGLSFPVAWSWMVLLGAVHAQILPAVIPASFSDVWPIAAFAVFSSAVVGSLVSMLKPS